MFEFIFNFWSFLGGILIWFLLAAIRIVSRDRKIPGGVATSAINPPSGADKVIKTKEHILAVLEDADGEKTIIE